MSQPDDWGVPPSAPATPTEYASRDNGSFDALLSGHIGVARPTYAVRGTFWNKDTGSSPLIIERYFFDGTDDILVASFDVVANTITFSGLEIGVDVQGFDADILKADTPDNLTAGFSTTVEDDGTQSSGTYTPDQDGGNFKRIVNGGAFTLAPQVDDCTIIIQVTNNGSAGTITTSGFTLVDGDSLTTVNGDDFFLFLVKANGFSSMTVKALQ